jgi:hypothetical protein
MGQHKLVINLLDGIAPEGFNMTFCLMPKVIKQTTVEDVQVVRSQ